MFVDGLQQVVVRSAAEVVAATQFVALTRATGRTEQNHRSSRSHAVLQLTVEKRVTRPATRDRKKKTVTQTARLSLIDLAGSERASQTQNRGLRLTEGANINKSPSNKIK